MYPELKIKKNQPVKKKPIMSINKIQLGSRKNTKRK